jgi:hypothetical protein
MVSRHVWLGMKAIVWIASSLALPDRFHVHVPCTDPHKQAKCASATALSLGLRASPVGPLTVASRRNEKNVLGVGAADGVEPAEAAGRSPSVNLSPGEPFHQSVLQVAWAYVIWDARLAVGY